MLLHGANVAMSNLAAEVQCRKNCCCSRRNAFKDYVKAILMRRNSITGVLYRDDPTIMAWDLANEPWVLGDDTGKTLTVCSTLFPAVFITIIGSMAGSLDGYRT